MKQCSQSVSVPSSEWVGVSSRACVRRMVSGLVGWGGYQVASFPVVLGVYLAAVSRILEQSDGSHVLVGVSLTREGRNSCTIILYDKLMHSQSSAFFRGRGFFSLS